MNSKNRFDDAIIGSSPLMLLQALHLAEQGRRVCVLERNDRFGGSWQTIDVGEGVTVEIASHVIELFPGVYEHLEQASGVEFVELAAQPVRIHSSGLTVRYFSKFMLAASGLRLLLGYGRARIRSALSKAKDPNDLPNFQTKLWSYLKYQTPCFFLSPVLKGPIHGFVDFIDKLTSRCREAGVEMRTFDVQDLRSVGADWRLENGTSEVIFADQVHSTTSNNLRRKATGHYVAKAIEQSRRNAAVVDVVTDDIVTSHTYAAFWADPQVSRISRIDMLEGDPKFSRFLVELREAIDQDDDLLVVIEQKLLQSGILSEGGVFHMVGRAECVFAQNADQLPRGEIEAGFFGYFSMGNLAAGIAEWLHNTGRQT